MNAISSQGLKVDGRGLATVTGLAAGRYHLRCFPDDFRFEPSFLDVPKEGEMRFQVKCTKK